MAMLSKLTCLIINSRDDIQTMLALDTVTNKYVGIITLGPESRCRILCDTGPIYNTKDEALKAMDDLVVDIKTDLDKYLTGKVVQQ